MYLAIEILQERVAEVQKTITRRENYYNSRAAGFLQDPSAHKATTNGYIEYRDQLKSAITLLEENDHD